MICDKNDCCDQINDLTHRIGSVRAWLKISLLIGFTLCMIIAVGQYIFTAQIFELQTSIQSLHLQLEKKNKGDVQCGK